MLGNFRFDDMVEKMSRRVAGRTSRRSVIGKVGTVMLGIMPELPRFQVGLAAVPASSGRRNNGSCN